MKERDIQRDYFNKFLNIKVIVDLYTAFAKIHMWIWILQTMM